MIELCYAYGWSFTTWFAIIEWKRDEDEEEELAKSINSPGEMTMTRVKSWQFYAQLDTATKVDDDVN